jgi:predicted transcriptional regulator
MHKKEIGEKLKRFRECLGLNYTQMGLVLDVSSVTVKNYETGGGVPLDVMMCITQIGGNYEFIVGKSDQPFTSMDRFYKAKEKVTNILRGNK